MPATTGARSHGRIRRPRNRLRSLGRDPGVEQEREAEPDHEVGDHAPHREEDRLPGGLPERRALGEGRVVPEPDPAILADGDLEEAHPEDLGERVDEERDQQDESAGARNAYACTS